MDLKEIRCFVAAYEEGSFTKAAEREHCTQPGLSVSIQRLESMVSHKLFDRHAGGVTPTVAGRHLYASCLEVLNALRAAQKQVSDMAGKFTGTVNIGVAPAIFKGALAIILPGFVTDHPYTDVCISEAYSTALSDRIASGEVDVAIISQIPAHLGLKTKHFCRCRLVLARRAHVTVGEATEKIRRIRAEELGRLKLILPSPRQPWRQMIDNMLRVGDSHTGKVLEIDGIPGALETVHNSEWATIVPDIAIIRELKQGILMADLISDPPMYVDFFIVWRNDSLLSPACKDLLARLRQTLEQASNGSRSAYEADVCIESEGNHSCSQPVVRAPLPSLNGMGSEHTS